MKIHEKIISNLHPFFFFYGFSI